MYVSVCNIQSKGIYELGELYSGVNSQCRSNMVIDMKFSG